MLDLKDHYWTWIKIPLLDIGYKTSYDSSTGYNVGYKTSYNISSGYNVGYKTSYNISTGYNVG